MSADQEKCKLTSHVHSCGRRRGLERETRDTEKNAGLRAEREGSERRKELKPKRRRRREWREGPEKKQRSDTEEERNAEKRFVFARRGLELFPLTAAGLWKERGLKSRSSFCRCLSFPSVLLSQLSALCFPGSTREMSCSRLSARKAREPNVVLSSVDQKTRLSGEEFRKQTTSLKQTLHSVLPHPAWELLGRMQKEEKRPIVMVCVLGPSFDLHACGVSSPST